MYVCFRRKKTEAEKSLFLNEKSSNSNEKKSIFAESLENPYFHRLRTLLQIFFVKTYTFYKVNELIFRHNFQKKIYILQKVIEKEKVSVFGLNFFKNTQTICKRTYIIESYSQGKNYVFALNICKKGKESAKAKTFSNATFIPLKVL